MRNIIKAHLLLKAMLCFSLVWFYADDAKAQDASPKDNPPIEVTAEKSGDNVVISWTTTSKTASYDVVRAKTNAEGTEIFSEETITIGITENQFTDETWQNDVSGYYKWGVRYSEATENPQEIIIGTETTATGYLPVNGQCRYTLSQQIYKKDEIEISGTISSIGFNIYFPATNSPTRNVIVYMKSTNDATFTSGSNWIQVDESDIVYQGNISIGSSGWVNINLTNNFSYTNDKNLLICVNDRTGSQSSTCQFYYTATTGYSGIYRSEININNSFNINNPGSGVTGNCTTKRPNLKLVIDGSVQQTYWSNVLHNKWYNVSIKSGIQNGTISASASIAQVGQTVQITAIPNEIYHLERLYYYPNDDVNNTTEIDIITKQFQMPEKDITVAAEFERDDDKFTISIKNGIQNGTITANVNYAQVGQTVQITSTPDENYHLENLYYYPDDDATDITEIDMTMMEFSMPAKDITVAAEFERDLVTYSVFVMTIMDEPIENATVTLSNQSGSYSANTNFQGWATLHIPGGSYAYYVSKEGYWTKSGVCYETAFEVVLHEKQDPPSHLYISATGWAMWNPFYNGEKDILGYKIKTADQWGTIEELNVTTPYHQFDVSKYWQGYVYDVFVATVYTGDAVSEYRNTEWGYMPCTRYNNVNNFLAEITDNNISMTWTQPDPKANHTLLGYMVFRGNKLLTPTLLGTDVTSFADDSEEASGNSTYCVKAVYDDATDENNGHFCMSCGSYMKPNEAYHWNGNEHQQVNSITVTAVIKINDVEQRASALEVGAFCGEQCRGAKRAIHFSETNKFIATFNVYGKEGDKIKFRLYDHSQGEELEYKCKSNFTFEPNSMFGNTEEPYEINFYSAVTQNQNLAIGNNWYSSYVTLDGKAGLQLMETGLETSANNIKSQNGYTTFVDNNSWFGSLTEANNREMYVINMASEKSLSLRGPSVETSEVAITTHQGWNWIGYPVENELNVNTALASLNPSVGDKIKSQSQQSEYGANGWAGELATMKPGQGYMYYQKAAGTQVIIYNADKSLDKSLNDNIKHQHWNPDIHKYAMNMSVTALIAIDGEIQNNDNLEVGAFCNGEVRGSASPIYYEPLDAYIVMLTVHGENSDDIVFKLYDSGSDSEYKSFSKETLRYSDNSIVGTLSELYTINFGNSNESGSVNFYPNPTERGKEISLPFISEKVEIFNAIGAKIAEYQNINKIKGIDASGTYIIRVTDGANVRYGKLIVE